jgi:hypothetical protein
MYVHGGCMGVSMSCSMDVSNVGRTKRSIFKRSICCNALLGGAMVFVSPLLNVNHSQMLALINNIEEKKFFDGSSIGDSKGSCWSSSSSNTKGSFFEISPPFKLKLTLNIKSFNNIFLSYHNMGFEGVFF